MRYSAAGWRAQRAGRERYKQNIARVLGRSPSGGSLRQPSSYHIWHNERITPNGHSTATKAERNEIADYLERYPVTPTWLWL